MTEIRLEDDKSVALFMLACLFGILAIFTFLFFMDGITRHEVPKLPDCAASEILDRVDGGYVCTKPQVP